MRETISNLIIKEIESLLDNEAIVIVEDKLFKEDLGLPSIKLIMLLTNVTSELNISIMDFSDYEILRLKSARDLIDLLTLKISDL